MIEYPFRSDYGRHSIQISNVCKTYKGKVPCQALLNTNLEINRKDVVVIIGANGSGKTTLLHSLIGEFEFDSGNISVFGQNIENNHQTMYQEFGVVFQEDVIFKNITANEICEFFGKSKSNSKPRSFNENHILLFNAKFK